MSNRKVLVYKKIGGRTVEIGTVSQSKVIVGKFGNGRGRFGQEVGGSDHEVPTRFRKHQSWYGGVRVK